METKILDTEAYNKNSANIDQLSTTEFVSLYIEEDKQVWQALKQAEKEIATAIDLVFNCLKVGGRLFYIGAGTSGRMGILDAVECPPTFSSDPETIQGFIAGGDNAIRKAVEGAEDDEQAGYHFVMQNLKVNDCLVGIAASGGTPYVIGGLKAAQEKGFKAIAISNNKDAETFKHCDHFIYLATGAEIISGSTRLKAGTSQKIVLNMISTGVMVKLGKVYGNLMVDVNASNKKLVKRACKLVKDICNCSEEEAMTALEASKLRVKQAVLKIKRGWDYETATKKLAECGGFLGNCL